MPSRDLGATSEPPPTLPPQAHEDMPHKADVLLLECLDTALLSEGILHYLQHLRGSFTAEHAAILPAAAVVKGMLVEMRSGEVRGVERTMVPAADSSLTRPPRARDRCTAWT